MILIQNQEQKITPNPTIPHVYVDILMVQYFNNYKNFYKKFAFQINMSFQISVQGEYISNKNTCIAANHEAS